MNGDRQLTARSAVPAPMVDTSKLKPAHSGTRHKLYRGRTTDGDIVVKLAAAELPSPQATMSIRHEYELLRDLELPGVVRVLGLAHTNEGMALLMDDAGPATWPTKSARDRFPSPTPWTSRLSSRRRLHASTEFGSSTATSTLATSSGKPKAAAPR